MGTVDLLLVAAIFCLAVSHHLRTTFLVKELHKLVEIVDKHTNRIIVLETQIERNRDNSSE